MRVFILVALGGVVSVLLAGFDPAIAAPCDGRSPKLQMCKRCTTVQDRATRRDTPCSGNFEVAGMVDSSLVIVGTSVAKQPQHGRLQASEGEDGYTPLQKALSDLT